MYLRSERAIGLQAVALRTGAPAPQSAPTMIAEAPREAASAPADKPVMQTPVLRVIPPAPLSREQKLRELAGLHQQIAGCRLCRLCDGRTQTVPGEGDVDAQLMFIGEAPGETEDRTGRPFVGRAGQKLDEMIQAMGLRRDQVYIANVIKCRPPDNRTPVPDEIEACASFIQRQIEIIAPRVIVTLGLPATRFLTGLNLSMGRMRGQWHTFNGIKVMPTFHPSYILRNYTVETRKAVWSDLQKVMVELGLQGSKASGPSSSG